MAATAGCWTYSKVKDATPAKERKALATAYNKWKNQSAIKRLEGLGYSCRVKTGGGDGTDSRPETIQGAGPLALQAQVAGSMTIKMQGKTYPCIQTTD